MVDILWPSGEVLASASDGGSGATPAAEPEEVRRYLMALVLIMQRGKVVPEGKIVIIAVVSVEMTTYGRKPCAFLCQGIAESSVGDEAVPP